MHCAASTRVVLAIAAAAACGSPSGTAERDHASGGGAGHDAGSSPDASGASGAGGTVGGTTGTGGASATGHGAAPDAAADGSGAAGAAAEAGAAGSGAAGSGGAGSGGTGAAACTGTGSGGTGGPCEFPAGVPDEGFPCSAATYTDTDPVVDADVNAALAAQSGCSVGSDCDIVGFPGTTAEEICQSWFAAVTAHLRGQGYCAGQHAVGSTDEIAVSSTGCTGRWYGYHVCNYGGPKVVWNPGARRGWWMIESGYCP